MVRTTTEEPPELPNHVDHHHMRIKTAVGILKPNPKYALQVSPSPITPSSFTEAAKDERWTNAMDVEVAAFKANQTWKLVQPNSSMNVLSCKWVFKQKLTETSEVEHFKACLVTNEMRQLDGIDMTETFAPVVKPASIKIILSFAVTWGWELRQYDVSNAFLHDILNGEVYMRQPPGYKDPDRPTTVCKLERSIYGLHQSPRAWFYRLRFFLVSIGFTKSLSDQSSFVYSKGDTKAFFLVYVDDIILVSSSKSFTKEFSAKIENEFPDKNIGELKYFLGIHVNRQQDGLIMLSQHQFLANLLHSIDMSNLKLTPI